MKIRLFQHRFWQWLERELVAVLAVGIVGLGGVWTLAGTVGTPTLNVTVLPAPETITVSAPNGGESWEIGASQNITWISTGSITDVKIELQREVAGSWETIVASTTNDGSYPWVVNGSATATATIRISEVGDATVNDSSDAVFSITAPVTPTPGGGGGGGAPQVAIDNVAPNTAVNTVDTLVKMVGQNFDASAKVKLSTTVLSRVTWVDSRHLEFTVPKGFSVGVYSLTVFDNVGKYATWGSLFRVVGATPEPAPNLFYASRWSDQSAGALTLTVGQETTVWVELVNSGTLPWTNFGKNPVRLGTVNPRDRLSKFKATWFSGWVLKNRPANVARQGQAAGGQQTINPGEIGRFAFKVKAPGKAGKYVENFGTVVEFRQWMAGTAQFVITVVPKARAQLKTTPSKASVTPLVPSSGVWDMPDLPEGPTEFYDGVEAWLKSFSNFFGRLVNGIGKF
ncbi:MAG: hypothetical protein V1826_02520 [bacterium]